jgi:hypothetical protein
MYRKPNIVATVTAGRLQWAGHPGRMSDDRNIKKVFLGKPDGRRKAGRPMFRLLDCTEVDLKSVLVKGWRERAEVICVGYLSE